MKLELFRYIGAVMRRRFDYCVTSFDDGRILDVYYGGTQPLKPGPNGVRLGRIAKYRNEITDTWYATFDDGDFVALRWVGGFASRREASIFLLGAKLQRDYPAESTVRGVTGRLEDVYTGRVCI